MPRNHDQLKKIFSNASRGLHFINRSSSLKKNFTIIFDHATYSNVRLLDLVCIVYIMHVLVTVLSTFINYFYPAKLILCNESSLKFHFFKVLNVEEMFSIVFSPFLAEYLILINS